MMRLGSFLLGVFSIVTGLLLFAVLTQDKAEATETWQTIAADIAGQITVETLTTIYRTDLPQGTPMTWAQGDMQERAGRTLKYRVQGPAAGAFNVSSISGGQDGTEFFLRLANAGDTMTVVNGGSLQTPGSQDIVVADTRTILYFVNIGGGNWQLVGGVGGGAGIGKVITDAIDTVTEMRVGSPTHWVGLYHNQIDDVPVVRGVCNGAECPNSEFLIGAGGVAKFIDSARVSVFEISEGGVVTHENKKPIVWTAPAFEVDEAVCLEPSPYTLTIPGGSEKKRYVRCSTPSTSGRIDVSVALDGSVLPSSAVAVFISARNDNAAPSGSLDFNVSAKCEDRYGGAAVAFGTAVPISLEFTNQGQWGSGSRVTLTPGGTCQPLSILSLQLQMLTGTGESDTQLLDTYIFDVMAYFDAERLTSD